MTIVTHRAQVAYDTLPIADAVCQTLSDLKHGKEKPEFFDANEITQENLERDLNELLTSWENSRIYD